MFRTAGFCWQTFSLQEITKHNHKQTNKQASKQASKQTNKQTNKERKKERNKQTKKERKKERNKQTKKERKKQTNKQTHTHTHYSVVFFSFVPVRHFFTQSLLQERQGIMEVLDHMRFDEGYLNRPPMKRTENSP